jgi:hypothetical protein
MRCLKLTDAQMQLVLTLGDKAQGGSYAASNAAAVDVHPRQTIPSAGFLRGHQCRAPTAHTIQIDLKARHRIDERIGRINHRASWRNFGEAFEDLFKRQPQLHLRDPRAKAFVHAMAEGEVLVVIVAHHVEPVWVGEYGRIAIGGSIPHDHFFVLRNPLTVQFRFFKRGAAHVFDRGDQT